MIEAAEEGMVEESALFACTFHRRCAAIQQSERGAGPRAC